MKEYSLIALDSEYEVQLLKALNRSKYKGIPVVATLSETKRDRPGRRNQNKGAGFPTPKSRRD